MGLDGTTLSNGRFTPFVTQNAIEEYPNTHDTDMKVNNSVTWTPID